MEEVKSLQDLTGDDRNNFLCRLQDSRLSRRFGAREGRYLGAALQSCIKTATSRYRLSHTRTSEHLPESINSIAMYLPSTVSCLCLIPRAARPTSLGRSKTHRRTQQDWGRPP